MESLEPPAAEGECLQGCQSTEHGKALTSALSLRGIGEPATIAFLHWRCCNCGQVVDPLGRSALHLAASCGGGGTASWLVRCSHANVNLRDAESGYTALHRSVFYGQIHVAAALIRLGANVSSLDYDDLTALDHAMKDRMPYVEFNLGNPCEAYVWGSNINYTLGVSNERNAPEIVDYFRKKNISIRQVAMNKFHSVFVSHDGRAFSCGHGQGGRLGLGSENTALQPMLMRFGSLASSASGGVKVTAEVQVFAVALGHDHSVLLAEGGGVWTCGLNAHHQLGHVPPPAHLLAPRALAPRLLRQLGEVQGVCAGRFHTVVWGLKGVMTFGLHAGQLGHAKGPEVLQTAPRLVTAISKQVTICKVAASDGATVVVTSKGDIYALHEYQCRKIASRFLDVAKVEVFGGHLDNHVDPSILAELGSDLRVAVLTTAGKLFLWQVSSQQMLRCFCSINRPLFITDVALCRSNYILLATRDGEAFEGEMRVRKAKKNAPVSSTNSHSSSSASSSGHFFREFLEKSDCEQVKVKRLPYVHRAVTVCCDPEGRNFAVVQTHPQSALLDIPLVETSEAKGQMKALLTDICIEDTVHDVVFLVGGREFPAHRFIVASHSEPLAKIMESKSFTTDEVPRVKVDGTKPDIFEQILQFIYTGECDMLKPGICCIKSREGEKEEDEIDINSISAYDVYSGRLNERKTKKKQPLKKQIDNTKKQSYDPVKVLLSAAKRFGLSSLQNLLCRVKYENGLICTEGTIGPEKIKFDRKKCQDFYDVTVKSDDGIDICAHKCILTARLEYFNCMLNNGWLESSKTSKLQLPVPHKVLEILLDFLYEDESQLVQESDDLDLLISVLVVSDQFFATRLKEICEVSLAALITLRNAAKILQIADIYNANQLKQCCMQYICLNLSAILEMRSLECVSDSVLEDITKYYQNFNPSMSRRVITPYSDAPSQSFVEAVAEAYPVKYGDNKEDIIELSTKKNIKAVKKKTRIRKTSVSDTNKVNERIRNESLSSNQSNISDDDEEQSLNFKDIEERPGVEDVTLELTKLQVNNSSSNEFKWIKVTDSKQKHEKIVLSRLKAILYEKENYSTTPLTYTKLSAKDVPISNQATVPKLSPQQNIENSPPRTAPTVPSLSLISDFPELNSLRDVHNTTPHKTLEIKKITKMSQKRRKTLAAELSDQTEKNTSLPHHAWGLLPNEPSTSLFLDIVQEEIKQTKLLDESICSTILISSPPKENPPPATNPWMKLQMSSEIFPESTVQFSNIIADEKKQRTNWTKMLAKPLELTQLEDQAIEDLLLFYNASNVPDERITVKRVITDTVATPTWITSHH